MCFDEKSVHYVDQICKQVIGNQPLPRLGVDREGEPQWNGDCVVQHTHTNKASPEVEEITFKKKKSKVMANCYL